MLQRPFLLPHFDASRVGVDTLACAWPLLSQRTVARRTIRTIARCRLLAARDARDRSRRSAFPPVNAPPWMSIPQALSLAATALLSVQPRPGTLAPHQTVRALSSSMSPTRPWPGRASPTKAFSSSDRRCHGSWPARSGSACGLPSADAAPTGRSPCWKTHLVRNQAPRERAPARSA